LNYFGMGQRLGINTMVSPRLAAVDRTLQFVRKGRVLSVTSFREEEAEAVELIASRIALCRKNAQRCPSAPRCHRRRDRRREVLRPTRSQRSQSTSKVSCRAPIVTRTFCQPAAQR
jgi:hypothetical protein